jgi:hypothetical protein
MQQLTETIQSFLEPWLLFLADDPTLRLLQGRMLLVGALVIFLVFFTTRDILLRTNSFLYMFVCILIVAALPVIGFLLYLLIRPARTLKERELYAMLLALKGQKGDTAASPKAKVAKKKI